MANLMKIVAIACSLCAPGAAMAAQDCHTDIDEQLPSGKLRHIAVASNDSQRHRAGDVTFSFQDRSPITINVNDPPIKPRHGMTGGQMQQMVADMHLEKKARVHYTRCYMSTPPKERRP